MKRLIFLSLLFAITFVGKAQDTSDVARAVYEYGLQLQDSIRTGETDFMRNSADIERLVDSCLAEFNRQSPDANPMMTMGLKRGLTEGLIGNFTLQSELLNNVNEGGDYKFMKYYEEGGEYFLIFRLSSIESAFAYHIYSLTISDLDHIQFYDLYTSMTGEMITETMASGMTASLLMQNPTSTISNDVALFKQAQELAYTSPKEALSILRKMDGPLRETSIFKTYERELIRFVYPEELYEENLAVLERETPITLHEANIGIAYWAERGELEYTNRLIEVAENTVGTDPYLLLYRAIAYSKSGQSANAIATMESIPEGEVTPFLDQLMRMIIYIDQGDYASACSKYEVILVDFELFPEDLESALDDYPDFLKSDTYRKWKKAFNKKYNPYNSGKG